MKGMCVRLIRGNPSKMKVYSNDPVKIAKRWADKGAELIHLVDLDAALSLGNNMEVIRKIVKNVSVKVQLGGGIRTFEIAEKLLNFGVFRIIFGTQFISNSRIVSETVQRFGTQRVAVALDVKNDKVMIEGWKTPLEIDYLEMARFAEDLNVGVIVFTCVDVNGTLRGPSMEHVKNLVKTVNVPVIVSGGISSLTDLVELRQIGAYGVIIGTALYEGRFSLEEALGVLKNVS
jgi:phosphoribosylformimino-5-aminoimidazole carboxamide ribotide isomerase